MKKPTLICAYDPLCGWCYGFGPVLHRLQERFSGQLGFEVVSGGMITGKAVGPLSHMAGFIRNAIPVVEQHTGIRFGEGFLQNLVDGRVVFSSLEPGNVLSVFKLLKPEVQVLVSHQIQCLIYRDGINPGDYSAYRSLFESHGLEWKEISGLLESAETTRSTINEFAQVQNWKIQGFPACILEDEKEKLWGISRGYLPENEMAERISDALGG